MSNNVVYKFSNKRYKENIGGEIKNIYSDFNSDLLRISSSPCFRRLQDKTQLFPMEKNDYARTRLTHSIETAAVGKTIAFIINKKISNNNNIRDLLSIVPACCFVHDIGNPPFGHYGEQIIRNYFKNNWSSLKCNVSNKHKMLNEIIPLDTQEYFDIVNFDGNAQGLRVLTNLEPSYEGEYGLNLTAAVLGGLIKYPYSSIEYKEHYFPNKSYKFGYFKSEQNIIDFLIEEKAFVKNNVNPVALIMEASDDIAMFVSDFEDSVKKGCITYQDIISYHCGENKYVNDFIQKIDDNIKQSSMSLSDAIRPCLYNTKRALINEVAETIITSWNENGYVYGRDISNHKSIIESTMHYPIIKMYKELMKEHSYCSRKIVIPELRGSEILNKILKLYCENILTLSNEEMMGNNANDKPNKVLRILSKNFLRTYRSYISSLAKDEQFDKNDFYARIHLIIDDISGMTDRFAVDLYNSLVK